MREKATACLSGFEAEEYPGWYTQPDVVARALRREYGDGGIRTADSEFIVSMSPAVALAVADWLESVAADIDEWDGLRQVGFAGQMHDHAHNVARAFLGDPS